MRVSFDRDAGMRDQRIAAIASVSMGRASLLLNERYIENTDMTELRAYPELLAGSEFTKGRGPDD